MTDKCRDEFEEWALTVNSCGLENALKRKADGDYLWPGTALCWEVWQAAYNLRSAEVERLRESLNDMIAMVESYRALAGGFKHPQQSKELQKAKEAIASIEGDNE